VKGILVDENLPETLVRLLGPTASHVTGIGPRMADQELWNYARAADFTVLTKDADFFDRLVVEGPPPKVVWIRTGNLRRRELENAIVRVWPEVLSLLQTADLVEVHTDRLEGIRFDPK
jgi:predicted nuclease of predicted toxin-antitoxin system